MMGFSCKRPRPSADPDDIPLGQGFGQNFFVDLDDLPTPLVGRHAEPEGDVFGGVDAPALRLQTSREDFTSAVGSSAWSSPPLRRIDGDRLVERGDQRNRPRPLVPKMESVIPSGRFVGGPGP
jgi:hypothetical protein